MDLLQDLKLAGHIESLSDEALLALLKEHRAALRAYDPVLVQRLDEAQRLHNCRRRHDQLLERRENLEKACAKWQRDAERFIEAHRDLLIIEEPEPAPASDETNAQPEPATVQVHKLGLAQRMARAGRALAARRRCAA